MQALTLVIGYGNPLCGDDGAGRIAVERLANEIASEANGPSIQCLSVFQLTPELVEPIAQAGCVLFVDAEHGAEVGAIHCRALACDAANASSAHAAFSHHLQPERLLESAASLYARRPSAYLFTIAGRSFALGDPFSPEVEAGIPELVRRIKESLVTSC